jgi:hypothetical protein
MGSGLSLGEQDIFFYSRITTFARVMNAEAGIIHLLNQSFIHNL